MSSEPTPFIPAKLDDADLTPHQFRVFCHVARRGECLASIRKMSDDTGVSEPTVRKALKTLRSASMIEREKRPGTTDKHRTAGPDMWDLSVLEEDEEDTDPSQHFGGDPSQDIGDPKKLPLQNLGDHPLKNLGGHPSQDFGVPSKGNPFEGNPLEGARVVGSADADRPPWLQRLLDEISWQAEPLPDDHPACWEYHPGEWEWEAAMYLLRGLQEHQVLHSGIDDSKPDGQIASKWADVFRLLHEEDGYGLPAIRGTLWWLINVENWWIQNVIQSGSNYALRSRDGDGAHKFDKLVQRARRYYEQRQRQRTDPDAIREGFAPESEQEPEPAGSSGDAIPDEREVEVSGFQW